MTKTKPKGPKKPPRPPKYRIMALFALMLAVAPACGDELVEQGIDCGDLAVHLADWLYLDDQGLSCGLESAPNFVIEFGFACVQEGPSEEEKLECLGAVYELTECPASLPSACLLFAAGVQVAP